MRIVAKLNELERSAIMASVEKHLFEETDAAIKMGLPQSQKANVLDDLRNKLRCYDLAIVSLARRKNL